MSPNRQAVYDLILKKMEEWKDYTSGIKQDDVINSWTQRSRSELYYQGYRDGLKRASNIVKNTPKVG